MSSDASTPISTYDDGQFLRTAIVAGKDDTGSLDIVAEDGKRLCQINISYLPDSDGCETLIIDVIDVDQKFQKRKMLAFDKGKRSIMPVPGVLVSVDFRRERKG